MSPSSRGELQGVLSPVLTPFDAQGAPCAARMVKHCRWLLDQDVGLAIFGTNSEGTSLSISEKCNLLDHLVMAEVSMPRVMAGTGACSVADAIQLTRHAVHAGCGGVLMLPPFYYKGVTEEGLYRSFAQVIDAVADDRLRVYLYHIPPVSQVSISFPLIERLMKNYPGTVAGIKDSSGEWEYTSRLLKEFQPRGLDVFAGNETVLLETMRAGGAGCITATGNVNPAAIVRLMREWTHIDADEQQQKLNATRGVFQALPIIAAMKATIARQSGDPGWSAVRPPLVELSGVQRDMLHKSLDAIGFSMPNALSLGLNSSDT